MLVYCNWSVVVIAVFFPMILLFVKQLSICHLAVTTRLRSYTRIRHKKASRSTTGYFMQVKSTKPRTVIKLVCVIVYALAVMRYQPIHVLYCITLFVLAATSHLDHVLM